MNIGYFTSFTVFLALNDPGFCNKYLRAAGAGSKEGLLPMGQYMRFWGAAYLIITLCVWAFKHEDNFQALGKPPRPDHGICHALLLLCNVWAVCLRT